MPLHDKQLKELIIGSWDQSSGQYDSHEGHGIKTLEEKEAWKAALTSAMPMNARSVLDIGCGTGELSLVFAELGYKVTGVDLSPKMLDVAKAKAKVSGLEIEFGEGDAETLPFSDKSFDVAFTRHLLWTLPHPQAAMDSWHKVLKAGGRAIVVDGSWANATLQGRLKKLAGDMGCRIFEGKTHFKGHYTPEVQSMLPNADGVPNALMVEYLGKASFSNITVMDISNIRRLQNNTRSYWERLRQGKEYYMACGDC